jgi:hypothetical protein
VRAVGLLVVPLDSSLEDREVDQVAVVADALAIE